ncbi:translation factor Guf1, mitochondrial-like isoform X1 [Styela clava]
MNLSRSLFVAVAEVNLVGYARNGRNLYRSVQQIPVRLLSSKKTSKQIDLSNFPPDKIRNFGIIAHVDHGKSTLADRLLEITGAIEASASNKQVLDKLQVEKERGITVKAQTASITYYHKGEEYLLNLIDTPGHVDFSYEVSRSLAACQGVLLVVDASQGVEAQTLSNFYLTMDAGIDVIPIINKIDLKTANVDAVCQEMEKFFDIDRKDIIAISAKTGINVESVLEAIIDRLPSPKQHLKCCNSSGPLKALVFDSCYENYKGVNANIAVTSGKIKTGDQITSHFLQSLPRSKTTYEVKDVGILEPDFHSTGVLYAGQVGCVYCGMKTTAEARIGDTFHHVGTPVEAFEGFKSMKPMVLGTMYPNDQSEYINLKKSIDKLTLNDSSVTVHNCNCPALGAGFRLGFLGLLHLDVFKQRLEQEYDATVICTTPTVPYKAILSSPAQIKKHGSDEMTISTAGDFPDLSWIKTFLQPMVTGTVMAPAKYLEAVIDLCERRNGVEQSLSYINDNRVIVVYRLPLDEIIVDFYDKLKSVTSGYGSFDYEDAEYEETNLAKVDILLNGKIVPELSSVFNESKYQRMARQICERLKETIPPQLFPINIQAVVGSKVIAKSLIKPYKRDIFQKLGGGDMTRKMKLVRKHKDEEKRLRMIGKVTVPRNAFVKVLQE